MDFFGKPPRHEIQEPQLATMIDVFSMLIIFLIAGTVMGVSSVMLPENMQPPRSLSKESISNAPQITLNASTVTLGFVETPFPLQAFDGSMPQELERFRREVKAFLDGEKGKADLGLVNFVSDRATPYQKIFNVVRATREAGFTSVLFVSTPKGQP